jgi:hypothetical protein
MLHLCVGRMAVVFLVIVVILGRGVGGGSGSTAACHRQGQAACSAGGSRCNCDEEVGKCATAGQTMVAKAETARG